MSRATKEHETSSRHGSRILKNIFTTKDCTEHLNTPKLIYILNNKVVMHTNQKNPVTLRPNFKKSERVQKQKDTKCHKQCQKPWKYRSRTLCSKSKIMHTLNRLKPCLLFLRARSSTIPPPGSFCRHALMNNSFTQFVE